MKSQVTPLETAEKTWSNLPSNVCMYPLPMKNVGNIFRSQELALGDSFMQYKF